MARPDGRALEELRPIRIEPGYNRYAEGSALIEVGHTRVLCTVSVEHAGPGVAARQGRGLGDRRVLDAAARDQHARRARGHARQARRAARTEIQRLLSRAFRAALDRELLGERTLWVDCDVLQADGGTRIGVDHRRHGRAGARLPAAAPTRARSRACRCARWSPR